MPHHPNTSHPFFSHRFSVRHASALPTLAANRLLAFAGTSMLGLFFPIFLYELFSGSLLWVFLWYIALFALRVPMQVGAAQIFSKTGLTPSMVIGTLGAVIFYGAVFVLDAPIGSSVWLWLVVALLGVNIFSVFYWTPFHIDFAEFSTKGRRGRQVAAYQIGLQMVSIAAPVAAGFLIDLYSYGVMFVLGMLLMILSLLPIFSLPRTHVRYEFGFFETFRQLFSKRFRWVSFSMMSYGAEDVVSVVVWPLFLFLVFQGHHIDVGIFAALILFLGVWVQYVLGAKIDKRPQHHWLHVGSRVYALGWFFKSLVTSVFGVFAASVFHTFGSILMRTPFEALYYERAADSGHYVDEFTVIRETALALGRFLMILLVSVVTLYGSLSLSFVLAALVSLGVATLTRVRFE